jgi:sulfide:quinone oxidoreductase
MPADVLVVGGGVAGVHTANTLARRLNRSQANIRVIDAMGVHAYQPGFTRLALDQSDASKLVRDVRRLLHKRVDLVVDEATRLDPVAGKLYLRREAAMTFDYLVLATGARLDRDAVPGLAEATHDYYSLPSAERLREALRRFRGGDLVLGVAGTPYKCPPTPVEFALLLERWLRRHGLRDRTRLKYLSPVNGLFPIEAASRQVEPALQKIGITLHPFVNIEEVDADRSRIHSLEGESFEFDLAILVPPHRGVPMVVDSGVAGPGGWIPTDPETLRVKGYQRLFAVGDATDLPISKSGSTAHFEAAVVAEQLTASIQGRPVDPEVGVYRGRTICFIDLGGRRASILVFERDRPPRLRRASPLWYAARRAFDKAYWTTIRTGLGFGVERFLRRI